MTRETQTFSTLVPDPRGSRQALNHDADGREPAGHWLPRSGPMRERELVARARAGDSESWSKLIEENGAALWAAIHDCGLQGKDAASVWQTTWLSAAQQLDALPTASGLRRWLLAKAAVAASRVKLRNWAAEESATRGRVIALAVMPAANSADCFDNA